MRMLIVIAVQCRISGRFDFPETRLRKLNRQRDSYPFSKQGHWGKFLMMPHNRLLKMKVPFS